MEKELHTTPAQSPNVQLVHQRMIELANETAHDINNPLTVVKGLLLVIKKEVNKENIDIHKINLLAAKAEKAIHRIADGVTQLRKSSREFK
jgi:signal transduction histidine kinase